MKLIHPAGPWIRFSISFAFFAAGLLGAAQPARADAGDMWVLQRVYFTQDGMMLDQYNKDAPNCHPKREIFRLENGRARFAQFLNTSYNFACPAPADRPLTEFDYDLTWVPYPQQFAPNASLIETVTVNVTTSSTNVEGPGSDLDFYAPNYVGEYPFSGRANEKPQSKTWTTGIGCCSTSTDTAGDKMFEATVSLSWFFVVHYEYRMWTAQQLAAGAPPAATIQAADFVTPATPSPSPVPTATPTRNPTPTVAPTAVEDPVSNVTWHVCAYPNPAQGCGDWRFLSSGEVQGLEGGKVLWSGRWTRLSHYVYRYDFTYEGLDNHQWVVFSDPQKTGHATLLMGYADQALTKANRKGELAAH